MLKYINIENSSNIKMFIDDIYEKHIRFISINVEVDEQSGKINRIYIACAKSPVAVIERQALAVKDIKNHLEALFKNKNIGKVSFDMLKAGVALKNAGFSILGNLFDIRIVYFLLYAGIKEVNKCKTDKSLEEMIYSFLSEKYVPDYLKHRNQNVSESTKEKIAIQNTYVFLYLKKFLSDRLDKTDLLEAATLEFECLPAIIEMHVKGIAIDKTKVQKLYESYSKILEELLHTFQDQLGQEISPYKKDLVSILNKCPQLKDQRIRLSSTDKNEITPFAENIPVIRTLCDYRVYKTKMDVLKKCLDCINPNTHRIHPEYDPVGTVTGRFSCKSPALQAMPADNEIRSCFVAKGDDQERYKFIIADYSQIELRIAAAISNDREMISAFVRGEDLHSLTASIMINKPVEEITKEERKAAKAVNFGILFGMSPKGLCEYARSSYGYKMTQKQARSFIDAFFEAYQGLDKWIYQQTSESVRTTRTMSGRRRRWKKTGRISHTELINTPIQGTAADIMKHALGLLFFPLLEFGAVVVASIHDEIIVEVKVDYADRVAKLVEQTMIEAAEDYLGNVPAVVDIRISDNWGNGKR